MDLGYWLYMNEAEGYDSMVDTREAKINAIGRELVQRGYQGRVVPQPVFLAICNKHGIYDITRKEIRQIERKWL